ncbi:MAG: hypothetical protein O7H41_11015 [Planctomycetota bacterium]|nr:hypothetical protein [Planctomycetota bacterium]
MKLFGSFTALVALVLVSSGCLTDMAPLAGTRTQASDGAGAKLFGFENATIGMGTTPDPYTVTQLVSYDNRTGLAPSPSHPVVMENAANNGLGAFSRDGLYDRDGHGTLNHKGIVAGMGTLHTFRRSVLAVDTAPGCQFVANIIRDNSGNAGAGLLLCFGGPAEIIDTMDLSLQDAQGNKIQSVNDLMGLLIRARVNDGDTSMDLGMKKFVFEDSVVRFREPLKINMGNARLFNFTLEADGNRRSMIQLVRHMEKKGLRTNDAIRNFTMDFGDFRATMPENVAISFNMQKMGELRKQFSKELSARRANLRH